MTKIEREEKKWPKAIIDPTMKDHSNDPFIVEKTAAAKEMIRKYGLPDFERLRKEKNSSQEKEAT